jgi:hypothetical protein
VACHKDVCGLGVPYVATCSAGCHQHHWRCHRWRAMLATAFALSAPGRLCRPARAAAWLLHSTCAVSSALLEAYCIEGSVRCKAAAFQVICSGALSCWLACLHHAGMHRNMNMYCA